MTKNLTVKMRAPVASSALAGQPRREELLAQFSALAALCLGLAEKLCELGVTVALCVGDVGLEPQRIAQRLLGEPDDVVVLVCDSGELPGLTRLAHGVAL